MNFNNPGWFLLTPLIVLIIWRGLVRRPPTAVVSDIKAFKVADKGFGGYWFSHPVQWPKYLLGAGLLFLVIALARPRERIGHVPLGREGVDIFLVLDLSGSMRYLFDDVNKGIVGRSFRGSPEEAGVISRLRLALRELNRLIEKREQDRIGLIVFARRHYLVVPPTLDHSFLRGHLEMLDEVYFSDGTGIAAPLLSAVSRLRESDAAEKAVVLFSDGEDNVPFPVSSRQAAELAADYNITIHTVGIGGEETFTRRNTLSGWELRPSTNTFDQTLLEEIADKTGGYFFKAADEAGFGRVMDELDGLITADFEDRTVIKYREKYLGWAVAGLLLLISGLVLERTFCRVLP